MLYLSQKDGKTTVEEKWYNRKMQMQHGTAVRSKNMVYGSSGGSGPSFLTAIDVRTGEIAVRQRGFSKANLLAVGDQILVLDEDGEFALGQRKNRLLRGPRPVQGTYHQILDSAHGRWYNRLPERHQRDCCTRPVSEMRSGHAAWATTTFVEGKSLSRPFPLSKIALGPLRHVRTHPCHLSVFPGIRGSF